MSRADEDFKVIKATGEETVAGGDGALVVVCKLESVHPAGGRRHTDGATTVGAVGGTHKPPGHRHGRATGRTARGRAGKPRVHRCGHSVWFAVGSEPQLTGLGLAVDRRPACAQRPDGGVGGIRHEGAVDGPETHGQPFHRREVLGGDVPPGEVALDLRQEDIGAHKPVFFGGEPLGIHSISHDPHPY